MSRRAMERLDAKYLAEIWRGDSLRYLAEILQESGVKKPYGVRRGGLAPGVRSLLR
jgi:hypothetical protein